MELFHKAGRTIRKDLLGHGSTRMNTDLVMNAKEKSVKSVFFRVLEISLRQEAAL
jgi:hypothetical protein